MNSTEYSNSRSRYVLRLAISLFFVAIGIWLIPRSHELQESITMIACALFFGACSAIFIFQIFDQRPRIVLDESGVLDRTLNVGTIAWEDIEGAQVRRINREPFICLQLKNEEKYTKELTKIGAVATKSNKAIGFSAINLNLSGVAVEPEELCATILRRAAESKAHK